MPTITINLTAQQGQRFQDALTRAHGVPATLDDAKAFIKSNIQDYVINSERGVALQAIQDNPFDPEVL